MPKNNQMSTHRQKRGEDGGQHLDESLPKPAQARPLLRDLRREVPQISSLQRSEEYDATVPVEKIVGSVMCADFYYNDWTPVKKDAKWALLEDALTEGRRLDEVSPARPIFLLQHKGEYWVDDDGHRRVALAKREGVKTVKCKVRDILP